MLISGWLNVWNPLKAEGAIQLDMSRREEKQLARMLIVMNYIGASVYECGVASFTQHFCFT